MSAALSRKGRLICERLAQLYPGDIKCYLDHKSAWELLCATILSAQCTDERVNKTTPALFEKYPDVFAAALAEVCDIEEIIKPCGFYRTKALHISRTARALVSEYGGGVPREIDELTALPGVGRKTANVIRGNIYNEPSVVVDTHVLRVSRLLGLTREKDPVKVELGLMEILPKEHWIAYNHRVIAHGRKICIARRPKCEVCGLGDLCVGSKSGNGGV